jgi:hypothetical protein
MLHVMFRCLSPAPGPRAPARPVEGSCRCCGLPACPRGPPGLAPAPPARLALDRGPPGACWGCLSPAGPRAPAWRPPRFSAHGESGSAFACAVRPAPGAPCCGQPRTRWPAHLRLAGQSPADRCHQRCGRIGRWRAAARRTHRAPTGAARGNYRSLRGQLTAAPGRRRSVNNERRDGARSEVEAHRTGVPSLSGRARRSSLAVGTHGPGPAHDDPRPGGWDVARAAAGDVSPAAFAW